MPGETGPLSGAQRKLVKFKQQTSDWQFGSLHELHAAVNVLLRQAILNERYKRWRKVIESYRELLWILNLDNFPDDYEPPSSYAMLMYELHFHLGVAYQQVGNSNKAVDQFSKSIKVVSISKNGCLAGCLTNSCLMTPIFARRAFAYACTGSYKLALKDAEKAVVLDSSSPDVYCIRALVKSTFDDELVGLHDLNAALNINKHHACAIILKASFTKPLVADERNHGAHGQYTTESRKQRAYEKLRDEAYRLCHDAETYLTCNKFTHPCILEFYDKFLFPLSVPHTITSVNLTPEKPSKKQIQSQAKQSSSTTSRPLSAATSVSSEANTEVFRCGTKNGIECNMMSLKRRTDYGNALRKHVGRPKSSKDFFHQLEKQRKMQNLVRRSQSAIVRPGEKFARPQKPHDEVDDIRPHTAPATSRERKTLCQSLKVRTESTSGGSSFHIPALGHSTPTTRQVKEETMFTDRTSRVELPKHKPIVIETPSDYVIPVFQPVNIKCAPRMYYRPWTGDKLPVAEREDYKYTPAFY